MSAKDQTQKIESLFTEDNKCLGQAFYLASWAKCTGRMFGGMRH
jgi:hypothetical protein